MSIDQHCGQDHQMQDYPRSQAEAYARIALEQSARYEARLAIARWISPSAEAALEAMPAPAMAQARWLEKVQGDFQQWLAGGGFSQPDSVCSESAAALAVPGALAIARQAHRHHTCID